jgi:lysyl-tRNA synthetase class 2
MLEWYRVGAPYESLMEDCAAFLRIAAETAGATRFAFRGREVDPFAAPERLSVAEACRRLAGIDLLATLGTTQGAALGAGGREGGSESEPNPEALIRAANAAGIRTAPDDTWADTFSRLLVERIEPAIGNGRATLLTEYPAHQAALARPKPGDPRVAERFELYACGVELANAFGELIDPAEQRRRLEAEMAEKQRLYGERYPIDEDFLAALAQMPPASGGALGFDRLVMLATGAAGVEQVMWTPLPEA